MIAAQVAAHYVYHSNALDGIVIPEEQTRAIVEGNFPGDEVLDSRGRSHEKEVVSSHHLALNYVHQLAAKKEPEPRRDHSPANCR